MLFKMDSTNRSDQNSLHLPGVWRVSALWLTQAGLCLKIWLSSEVRHYVVHTVCTAFISQTTDKPLNWLEEKKTKISIFEFVMEFSGVSWCFSQFHVSISALFIPKPPRHWCYLVAQPNFISTPKARESEELATISAHLDRQLYLLFSFHKPIKARQLLHQIKWKTV